MSSMGPLPLSVAELVAVEVSLAARASFAVTWASFSYLSPIIFS